MAVGEIPPNVASHFRRDRRNVLAAPRQLAPGLKGTIMRTAVATVLFSIFLAAPIESQPPAKKQVSSPTRVALVNLQRITNSGINYEKIRLLSLDKATLKALKKINKEIQEVQTQIVDVNDETTLAEMGRRLNFLTQKNMLLRQRSMSGDYTRDVQGQLRKFVIDKYKNKYSLILQQQDGYNDRVIFKAPDAEIDDITDEARDEFQKHIDQIAD
jgi:hypothetical protein